MSIHTGRMSRRDCAAALTTAGAAARTLARPELARRVEELVGQLNAGHQPAARDVRALLVDVNEQAWLRLEASQGLAPSIARAVVVTFWGRTSHQDVDRAFLVAAEELNVDPGDLAMVDSSPVVRPDAVGTRFTLREM